MTLLYSDIPPLKVPSGQETINACFHRLFSQSDEISIAVGYISRNALDELDSLIEQYKPKRVVLTMGMYYIEGMPESSYHKAKALNKKWVQSGRGEIRVVRSMKYHGKLYLFSKDGLPVGAIDGSANLGVISSDANNLRQYEVATLIESQLELSLIRALIDDIVNRSSVNIDEVDDMKIIRENNSYIGESDSAEKILEADVDAYKNHTTNVSFSLPLKVPTEAERRSGEGHFMKSNINVCYAAPRSARKSRDWYEIQITVDKEYTLRPGYPEKNKPFYIVTDDGYKFKAHTTSDGNKQLNAVGDELLIGRWLKGRLASAGLVTPVNDTMADVDKKGMITKEMLDEYGRHTLQFTKTDEHIEDPEEGSLDVWLLLFE